MNLAPTASPWLLVLVVVVAAVVVVVCGSERKATQGSQGEAGGPRVQG